ncbi:MAG: hypothetical protein KGQ93_01640 [Cyanobacteria bacterium REEB459]|nr:hypothetical protein [Cyanobacteria bacterium REEB459]
MRDCSNCVSKADLAIRLCLPPARRRRFIYLGLGVATGLAALGGSALNVFLTPDAPGGLASQVDSESAKPERSQPLFRPHLLSASSSALADPALLLSTPPAARLTTVATGRVDPFRSILAPGSNTLNGPLSASSSGPALPLANPAAILSGLPSAPVVAPQTALPPVISAGAADARVTTTAANWADQLIITGIAQVGSQVSVMVTEPGQPAGRRVQLGETLWGGRVRLKMVDLSGAEPQIILTYGNRDYRRSVGAGLILGQR